MLQRIKRAIRAFNEPQEVSNTDLQEILLVDENDVAHKYKIAGMKRTTYQDIGDGKAVFLGEGTINEFQDQQEQDKGFTHKPFGL